MKDINLIDSCQAHLLVHYAGNIKLIHQRDTGIVIDRGPHLNHTCKTSLLFAPLVVRVYNGCLAFPFYTPSKPLIRVHIKNKPVLFHQL